MKVFVAASHKGGTGRSVSMANAGYRLSVGKTPQNVCFVDLDLASPTFGTVLGLEGLETGVPSSAAPTRPSEPRSITDVLEPQHEDAKPWLNLSRAMGPGDVWTNGVLKNEARGGAGDLSLLPGRQGAGDKIQYAFMTRPLRETINVLDRKFDIAIFDVRSGLSEPLRAFFEADLAEKVTAYLFHFRWTPQQLNGLGDALERSREVGMDVDKVRFVRTAVLDADVETGRESFGSWMGDRNSELQQQFDEVRDVVGVGAERIIGQIPIDPVLQWKETIITQRMVSNGVAAERTLKAFDELAANMHALGNA